MENIGTTIDGKQVVKGVAKYYFQYGLPLSILFNKMDLMNLIPSWLHLYWDFKENGVSDKRIYHLLHEHILDSYGKEMRDVVLERLKIAP